VGFTTTVGFDKDDVDEVEEVAMSTVISVKQTGQELAIPLVGRAVRLQVSASVRPPPPRTAPHRFCMGGLMGVVGRRSTTSSTSGRSR
jgi:hypothetical protein